MNPANVLNISLTDPIAYNITDAACIDCVEGSYNFTYAVQVSHSYPGTNAKLNIGFPNGGDRQNTKWNKVALCKIPTEPEEYYAEACVDHSRLQDSNFNVTPNFDMGLKNLGEFGAEYEIEVGKVFKNVYIFRLTKNDQLTQEELCSYELSEHITEFRIWFLRMCYGQPQKIDFVAPQLGIGGNFNKDEANIDDQINLE